MEDFFEPMEEVAAPDHTKRRRGRPEGIDDDSLFASREYLLHVAGTSWPDILLPLQKIKDAADVRSALRSWEPYRDSNPVISSLLRETTRTATPKRLRDLEKQRALQIDVLQASDERRKRARASFEKTSILSTPLLRSDGASESKPVERSASEARASITRLTTDQEAVIDKQWVRHASEWDTTEGNYNSEKKKLDDLLNEIRDCHAYIVQAETVLFCRSGRYAFTPVNLANALAGLPHIKYRQSIKRCGLWDTDNGPLYRSIGIVERIVLSCENLTKLGSHAKEWLTSIRISKSGKNFFAVSQLGENFYYLNQAIEAVVPTKPRSDEIAVRIIADYYRRCGARGPADLLFEQDERIVIKCK